MQCLFRGGGGPPERSAVAVCRGNRTILAGYAQAHGCDVMYEMEQLTSATEGILGVGGVMPVQNSGETDDLIDDFSVLQTEPSWLD